MAANFAVNNIRDFEFIIKEWLPTDGVADSSPIFFNISIRNIHAKYR